ncbi:MAG: DUF4394 domain-containing protein, partial [Pyrinomonadaceae bacterium MAG19_C2-C3]|nr:DUF4394 domain-containing protein [Pyrinomonadaceae bacterium MAG19_C2-C3]
MQINLRSSRRARRTSAVLILAIAISLFGNTRLSSVITPTAHADMNYFNLAGGNFSQDWSNTELITINDDWSGVPSITGFLGNVTGNVMGVDPQTILDPRNTVIDVVANQTNPNTLATRGVAEFEMTQQNAPANANPTIALQGSGMADSPYINIYLNTTGRSNITVSYNLRDVDGSTDNAVQPIALQYRVGATGNYTNVPAGFVADASARSNATAADPANATLVTPVSAVLPVAAENQAQVQVRIITANAVPTDEWIGVDDINVTSTPLLPLTDSQTVYGVTSGNTLINFNTTSPGTVNTVGTITGITETIIGIDFRPSGNSTTRGLLYAVTNDGGTGRIYTIDLQTAAATFVSMLAADTVNDTSPDYAGLVGTSFGVDFNPVPDRLRVVSNTGQNLRINVDTGATITDGEINPGTPTIVAVAYTNPDNDPSTGTMLYDIDTSTSPDTLFIQSPPNDGTLVLPAGSSSGNLGFDSTGGGFDIARNGNGFAVMTSGGASNLYQIVLSSGRAILGGVVGSASPITAISIADISPTADTVTIEGRATTANGAPLSGVTLRLAGTQQSV